MNEIKNSITFNGVTRTFEQWDELKGYPKNTVKRRKLISKWDDARCINAPLGNSVTSGRIGAKRSPWRYGSNFIGQTR